jgi:hypothetical protein
MLRVFSPVVARTERIAEEGAVLERLNEEN